MHQTDYILRMEGVYKRRDSHGISAALILTEINFAKIIFL